MKAQIEKFLTGEQRYLALNWYDEVKDMARPEWYPATLYGGPKHGQTVKVPIQAWESGRYQVEYQVGLNQVSMVSSNPMPASAFGFYQLCYYRRVYCVQRIIKGATMYKQKDVWVMEGIELYDNEIADIERDLCQDKDLEWQRTVPPITPPMPVSGRIEITKNDQAYLNYMDEVMKQKEELERTRARIEAQKKQEAELAVQRVAERRREKERKADQIRQRAGGETGQGPGPCPICGKRTRLMRGKYGMFFSCVQYPKCKGTRTCPDEVEGGPQIAIVDEPKSDLPPVPKKPKRKLGWD